MLEQFGLSNYENKAYLTLLELYKADARTISNKSGVPYGRIYDTLETLTSKNIISEDGGRPKQYTVVEPELAVEKLLKDKQTEFERLQKQAEITAQKLNKQYEGKPEEELVWKVAIGDELYASYFELLSEARSEFFGYIDVSASNVSEMKYIENYRNVLQSIYSKGADIRIILGIDDISIIENMIDEEPQAMELLNLGEIRYSISRHLGFSIIDKEKVILKVVNPVQEDELLAGIYIWKNSLGSTLRSSFLQMWDKAQPLRLQLIG